MGQNHHFKTICQGNVVRRAQYRKKNINDTVLLYLLSKGFTQPLQTLLLLSIKRNLFTVILPTYLSIEVESSFLF